MYEIDLLEKREGKGKTRKVKEYRLKDPKIELNLELESTQLESENIEYYIELYRSLLKRTKSLYGSVPISEFDFEKEVKEENIDDLIDSIRKLLEYNERTIGLHSTKKLVKRSGEEVLDNYSKTDVKHSILDVLPPKYFDLLKEEIK